MIATAFDEENGVLDKPPGMSAEDCDALSVWRGLLQNQMPVVISCWEPTVEELAEINRTGRVWLMIVGPTMPPACLAGVSPFKPS